MYLIAVVGIRLNPFWDLGASVNFAALNVMHGMHVGIDKRYRVLV